MIKSAQSSHNLNVLYSGPNHFLNAVLRSELPNFNRFKQCKVHLLYQIRLWAINPMRQSE